MLLFHGSLSEYVMIWGSAVDTTGHSGRNWAEFHDWIISGEGIWWKEGGITVKKEKTGTRHYTNTVNNVFLIMFLILFLLYVLSITLGSYMYTPTFQGGIVQLKSNTWMLEHCHGVRRHYVYLYILSQLR